jgi:hypothetical protein
VSWPALSLSKNPAPAGFLVIKQGLVDGRDQANPGLKVKDQDFQVLASRGVDALQKTMWQSQIAKGQ